MQTGCKNVASNMQTTCNNIANAVKNRKYFPLSTPLFSCDYVVCNTPS